MLSKFTRTLLIRDGGRRRRAHRVIMERLLGRPLSDNEHVHHLDKNPLNNDPANLQVMTKAEHERLEERRRHPDTRPCAVCGAIFTVNPRKRGRNKCCSHPCAQSLRVAGRKAQALRARHRREAAP